MNSKTKTHNCAIDICRYLCAVLVVAIHTEPFTEISPYLAFCVKHLLARIAVPFFFAVSGFFYTDKLSGGSRPFGPYVKRLLSVYLSWFAIYLAVNWIQHSPDSPFPFLLNAAKGLFFNVSPSHFWFFPALIYCVCLITLLNRFRMDKWLLPLETVFCILGILGGSFLEAGQQIPILNRLYLHPDYALLRKYLLMAPSYFLLGAVSYRLQKKLLRFSNKRTFLFWLLSGMLWAAEIIYIKYIADRNLYTGMSCGLYLFVFFTFMLLLRCPLSRFETLSRYCRAMANFTYYSHLLFINLINQFTWNILWIDLNNTQMFYACTLLTGIIGLIVFKCNHKWLNPLIR